MNRTIALFVALAVLVAHVLAIHNDGSGSLAFPYDQAHVPYRLARNLVLEGQLQWNPGSTAFESYSSPLWVAICTIGERVCATRIVSNLGFLSINLFCQAIGALAILVCVVLSAQFRPERTASLIAPLILVTTGCVAAAAANGLETGLFALLAVGTFLAFERARPGWLAASSILLCLTRPEGVAFVIALLVCHPFARALVVGEEKRARRAWPLFAALVVFGATCFARQVGTGFLLPPSLAAAVRFDVHRLKEGVEYLADFARTCPGVVLALIPIGVACAGKLSGVGARALVLAAAWLAFVAVQGRAPLPFCELCVPALPFLAIAIQEGMIEALDSPSMLRRRAALSAFAIALAADALPSREPADLGPLPFERVQRAWLAPSASARFGYAQALGRAGLEEEIARTHLLRGVGIFLRDRLDASWSVLTPWPGAIGYFSRGAVYDLCGRATSIGGVSAPETWSRRARVDVVAALRSEVGFDFVVPELAVATHVPTPAELARTWRAELDRSPGDASDAERVSAIERELDAYELVTVPIEIDSRSHQVEMRRRFLLLRRKSLDLAPQLAVSVEEGELVVRMRHRTHHQVADLRVECVDDRGRTAWMRPTGELATAGPVSARTELLLYDTGTRAIDAVRVPMPKGADGARVVSIRAWLRNPDAVDPVASGSNGARAEEQPFARASDVVSLVP